MPTTEQTCPEYIFCGLAHMGVGPIAAVDSERVESGNRNRQILYSEDDVGRLRIEVVKERFLAVNRGIGERFVNQRTAGSRDFVSLVMNRNTMESYLTTGAGLMLSEIVAFLTPIRPCRLPGSTLILDVTTCETRQESVTSLEDRPFFGSGPKGDGAGRPS